MKEQPQKKNKSVFSMIIDNEIPSKRYFEDDQIIVIWDIDQSIKDHLLVIWKEEIPFIDEMDYEKTGIFFAKANKIAKQFINDKGHKAYKLLINNRKEAGQEVEHVHIHILPYN